MVLTYLSCLSTGDSNCTIESDNTFWKNILATVFHFSSPSACFFCTNGQVRQPFIFLNDVELFVMLVLCSEHPHACRSCDWHWVTQEIVARLKKPDLKVQWSRSWCLCGGWLWCSVWASSTDSESHTRAYKWYAGCFILEPVGCIVFNVYEIKNTNSGRYCRSKQGKQPMNQFNTLTHALFLVVERSCRC